MLTETQSTATLYIERISALLPSMDKIKLHFPQRNFSQYKFFTYINLLNKPHNEEHSLAEKYLLYISLGLRLSHV